MAIRQPASINDIRTAIRELSVRAELAHKEGREQDAAEIERRIQGYRDELGQTALADAELAPSRRKTLRWNTIGATSGVDSDVADPQHHDRVIPGGDQLLDRAFQPDAGALDEHRAAARWTPSPDRRTGRRSWRPGCARPRRATRPAR